MDGLQIGQAASETGIPVETIQYYERVGLVPPHRKGSGNYRLFDDEVINRLVLYVMHSSSGCKVGWLMPYSACNRMAAASNAGCQYSNACISTCADNARLCDDTSQTCR